MKYPFKTYDWNMSKTLCIFLLRDKIDVYKNPPIFLHVEKCEL